MIKHVYTGVYPLILAAFLVVASFFSPTNPWRKPETTPASAGILLPPILDLTALEYVPPEPRGVGTNSPVSARKAPILVRGIYVTGWVAGSSRFHELVQLVDRTELNAMVIDLKDDTGYLTYASQVPLAQEIKATTRRAGDLAQILALCAKHGIYPIARIVVFKDPVLAAARPNWAVHNRRGGLWKDRHNLAWTNPYNQKVWEYNIAIAKEAIALGFPEVQFDYVRFPSDGAMADLVYPGQTAMPPSQVIGAFLAKARAELHAFSPKAILSADTFGLMGTAIDGLGIGQRLEDLAPHADYLSPMVYPSHYAPGSYGLANPNALPYTTVKESIADHLERMRGMPTRLRPWLQDFSLGSPRYGAAEVAAQIRALHELGIEEWLLWSPSCRYTEAALRAVPRSLRSVNTP